MSDNPISPNFAIKLAMRSLKWRIANINRDSDPSRYDEWYADFNKLDAEIRAELREIGYYEGNEISEAVEIMSAGLSSDMVKLLDELWSNSPLAGKDPSFPMSNLDRNWQGSNVKPIR